MNTSSVKHLSFDAPLAQGPTRSGSCVKHVSFKRFSRGGVESIDPDNEDEEEEVEERTCTCMLERMLRPVLSPR